MSSGVKGVSNTAETEPGAVTWSHSHTGIPSNLSSKGNSQPASDEETKTEIPIYKTSRNYNNATISCIATVERYMKQKVMENFEFLTHLLTFYFF